MKNVSEKHQQAGFSLVETIAAMGILALAAIPLLQLVNNSIRGSSSLEHRFLARTVAENLLVQQIIEPALPNEKIVVDTGVSKQLGRSFSWTMTTSPVQETAPQLVVVEVRLENSPQVIAQLTGVRLPVQPPLSAEMVASLSDEQEVSGGEER